MNQSEHLQPKTYLIHSNLYQTLINHPKLHLIKNFLFVSLMLISVEGIAQSTVKLQNKTACTIQFQINFYNGNNSVFATPTLAPLSVTTVTIPNGYYFCTLKADYPGGATPDILRSIGQGICSGNDDNPNNRHNGDNMTNLGGGSWDFSFY